MTARQEIRRRIDEAGKIASQEIERLARKILREHPELDEFIMAMGGAFFVKKDGEHLHTWDRAYMRALDKFISEWDDTLGMTGEPMRFTATGRKQTAWGANVKEPA